MKRRDFVKTAAAMGTGLLLRSSESFALRTEIVQPEPDPTVKRVLVMFKCHFDAGFIDTQYNVVHHRYFEKYFPQAIDVARAANAGGKRRYVWTTGSWLLFEYLEQASAADRKAMEEAIGRGDIAWHALPFTWQTEMLSPSMIEGSLAISGKRLAEPVACEDGKTPTEQGQVQLAVAILQSLPGVGKIVLAVLLAEAFEVLQRGDYAILRILCGVAPVTRRSGKSRIVTRRLACNGRLRNAIHYLADAARRCDAKSKAKYIALRARGCSHARALRTIGDRLLYVACTMLKNGTPFDPCFEAQNCAC